MISHIPFSLIEMINLDHEIPVEVERSDQDRDLSFETDDSFTEVHNNRVESEENISMSIVLLQMKLL